MGTFEIVPFFLQNLQVVQRAVKPSDPLSCDRICGCEPLAMVGEAICSLMHPCSKRFVHPTLFCYLWEPVGPHHFHR